MNRFWVGFCIYGCWTNFIQDFYGHDRYLMLADQMWVNSPVWLWPLLALFVCGMAILDEKFSKPEREKAHVRTR